MITFFGTIFGVGALAALMWVIRGRRDELRTQISWIRLAGIVIATGGLIELAALSLTAVIVAGVTMTVLILDAPADLVATTWGRILIAKTLAVAVAAGMGAYNHFKLLPALEQSPDDPALARELRTSLTIESAVLGVVTVLTAVLVGSAT